MYYLSVYVKSFKELFLLSLRESVFLKSECKSTNYFSFPQIFSQKSWDFSTFLTLIKIFWSFSYHYTLFYTCIRLPARAHTRKRINNIVLIFQDRKEIRIQLEKYYPENISIKEEYYYTKKNIIEEKGETQKNILPIKKNIVPLHTF